jgi:hypothetical protein
MGRTIAGLIVRALIDTRTATGLIAMGIAKHTGVTITATTTSIVVARTAKATAEQ